MEKCFKTVSGVQVHHGRNENQTNKTIKISTDNVRACRVWDWEWLDDSINAEIIQPVYFSNSESLNLNF